MNKKLSAISHQLSASSSCAPGVPPCSDRRSRRASFSLAELMIAITILGIGLLVVAAMFPIAWGKARDLAQHTTAVTCAETAEMTVKLLARVDSATEGQNFTSFAGDYLVETATPIANDCGEYVGCKDRDPMLPHDTLVHALTMHNVLTITPAGSSPLVTEEGWRLIDAITGESYDLNQPDDDPEHGSYIEAVDQWYGPRKDQEDQPEYAPQVRLHERVYPSVDPYPDAETPDPEEVEEWNARLDTRRYCWAVFHRLTEPLVDLEVLEEMSDADFYAARRAAASGPRTFTMYYVTLRRTPGQRFARQDADELRGNSPQVQALPHTGTEPTDVKFPTPWLVPLITPKVSQAARALNFRDQRDPDEAPRGVPTEVLVEYEDGKGDDLRTFFGPGTPFIDALTGEVYRVTKQRAADDGFNDTRFDDSGPADLEAMLTLDREIFMEDLRADPDEPYNDEDPEVENLAEDLRWVWVFPPPIERVAADEWIVDGTSPVVAIEVRSLVIHPQ